MTKICSDAFSMRNGTARVRTVALIVMTLIDTATGAGLVQSTDQSDLVSSVVPGRQSKAPSKSCFPVGRPEPGISKDGEFLPAYSVRSVAHPSKSGQKYVGYHSWCEINSTSHNLRWESDTVNAMNEFMVCRYNLGGSAVKEVYLDFLGGRIDFTGKDGSGKGDAFALAVYEGSAPATLFKGKSINFGKPLFGPKKWSKLDKNSELIIERVSVPIRVRPGVKELSVVLVGVDSWIDTKVTIQIYGLKLLSNPPTVQRPLRKK